jgi:hypothetical protein
MREQKGKRGAAGGGANPAGGLTPAAPAVKPGDRTPVIVIGASPGRDMLSPARIGALNRFDSFPEFRSDFHLPRIAGEKATRHPQGGFHG